MPMRPIVLPSLSDFVVQQYATNRSFESRNIKTSSMLLFCASTCDLISVSVFGEYPKCVRNDSFYIVLRIESYSQNCKKSTTSAALGYPDQAGIQRDRWPVLASLSFCCVFYFRITLYVNFIALWLNEWLVATGIPLQSVVLKRSVSARRRRKFWAFTGCSGTIPPCQNTNPERFYQGNPKKISQNLVFFAKRPPLFRDLD